jgi:hypothetical protein
VLYTHAKRATAHDRGDLIRKMTACRSMIAIGLLLTGCASQQAQLTPEEKKYADDTSFCRATTAEMPEQTEAFARCMASRGWQGKVPPPPPRPRQVP